MKWAVLIPNKLSLETALGISRQLRPGPWRGNVLQPSGRKGVDVAGLTYPLVSHPDSVLKREIMVKESPSLSQSPSNLSILHSLPKGPTHRGAYDRVTCPAMPSLYSPAQKSKRVNVRSMVAPSPGLSRVMEPPESKRALPLRRRWDLKAEAFLLRGLLLLLKVQFGSLNCTRTPTLHSPTGMQGYQLLVLFVPFPHFPLLPLKVFAGISTISNLLKCVCP